jgi:hypothetical protein
MEKIHVRPSVHVDVKQISVRFVRVMATTAVSLFLQIGFISLNAYTLETGRTFIHRTRRSCGVGFGIRRKGRLDFSFNQSLENTRIYRWRP